MLSNISWNMLEMGTKVHEDFTITEKASSSDFSLLKALLLNAAFQHCEIFAKIRFQL